METYWLKPNIIFFLVLFILILTDLSVTVKPSALLGFSTKMFMELWLSIHLGSQALKLTLPFQIRC